MVRLCLLLIGWIVFVDASDAQSVADVRVSPTKITLVGPNAKHSVLVEGTSADGRAVDHTRIAKFNSKAPQVVKVEGSNRLVAVADGLAEVEVEVGAQKKVVTVTVQGTQLPRAYHFENDILPILNRHGCNASGCHAKSGGQNGFQLSVFGSDPTFDLNALTKEARGRRVFPAAPDASLLLGKASGRMPHGGGTRIPRGNPDYETLRGWIAAGCPIGLANAPTVVSVRVEPSERSMVFGGVQQLRVIAKSSDGQETDVTHHARFQANSEGLASVNEEGWVTAGQTPGEVAIMANYQNQVAVFRALIPRPGKAEPASNFAVRNFIDEHSLNRWKKLNLAPSAPADDSQYLRRVYLDVIGTLPSAAEARRFLDDTATDKREKLVNDLLRRPEFADYWALYWADALRVDRQALGAKRAYAFYRWLRDRIGENQPFDALTRDLLTAEGPLDESPQGAFYKVVRKPGEMASSLSQTLLGLRIACAECHHHPFDRWSQTDYYGMQSFFSQVSLKTAGPADYVEVQGNPETRHPRTNEKIYPHALGTAMPTEAEPGDRRAKLAAWMTDANNPFFAKNLANRVWARFFGRGLIDPVDDVRDTNPPSNPELLDALAEHLKQSRFDLKSFIRTLVQSSVYQRSSTPIEANEKDAANFARSYFRRLDAEVLLDMVSQTTGVEESFRGMPKGTRAIQLWDSKIKHYFLKLHGRPERASACSCERIVEPSVAQVLHLLNAPEIQAKLSHDRGTVARLVGSKASNDEIVRDLYLTFFSRFPTETEKRTALEYLARQPISRRAAAEDLAWSLLNSLEFVFNH